MFQKSQIQYLPYNIIEIVSYELCPIHRKIIKYFDHYYQHQLCEICFDQYLNYLNKYEVNSIKNLEFDNEVKLNHQRQINNQRNFNLFQQDNSTQLRIDCQQEDENSFQKMRSNYKNAQDNQKRQHVDKIYLSNDKQYSQKIQKQDRSQQVLHSNLEKTKQQLQIDYIDELRKKVQKELDESDGSKEINKSIAKKIFEQDSKEFTKCMDQQNFKKDLIYFKHQFQFQQYPQYLIQQHFPESLSSQNYPYQQLPFNMQTLKLDYQSCLYNIPNQSQFIQQNQVCVDQQISKIAKVKYILQNNDKVNQKLQIKNPISSSFQNTTSMQADSRQQITKIENDISDQTTNYSELKNYQCEEIKIPSKNRMNGQIINSDEQTTNIDDKLLNDVNKQINLIKQNKQNIQNKQNQMCYCNCNNQTNKTSNKEYQQSQQLSNNKEIKQEDYLLNQDDQNSMYIEEQLNFRKSEIYQYCTNNQKCIQILNCNKSFENQQISQNQQNQTQNVQKSSSTELQNTIQNNQLKFDFIEKIEDITSGSEQQSEKVQTQMKETNQFSNINSPCTQKDNDKQIRNQIYYLNKKLILLFNQIEKDKQELLIDQQIFSEEEHQIKNLTNQPPELNSKEKHESQVIYNKKQLNRHHLQHFGLSKQINKKRKKRSKGFSHKKCHRQQLKKKQNNFEI